MSFETLKPLTQVNIYQEAANLRIKNVTGNNSIFIYKVRSRFVIHQESIWKVSIYRRGLIFSKSQRAYVAELGIFPVFSRITWEIIHTIQLLWPDDNIPFTPQKWSTSGFQVISLSNSELVLSRLVSRSFATSIVSIIIDNRHFYNCPRASIYRGAWNFPKAWQRNLQKN